METILNLFAGAGRKTFYSIQRSTSTVVFSHFQLIFNLAEAFVGFSIVSSCGEEFDFLLCLLSIFRVVRVWFARRLRDRFQWRVVIVLHRSVGLPRGGSTALSQRQQGLRLITQEVDQMER